MKKTKPKQTVRVFTSDQLKTVQGGATTPKTLGNVKYNDFEVNQS